jgi:hypothetical protein
VDEHQYADADGDRVLYIDADRDVDLDRDGYLYPDGDRHSDGDLYVQLDVYVHEHLHPHFDADAYFDVDSDVDEDLDLYGNLHGDGDVDVYEYPDGDADLRGERGVAGVGSGDAHVFIRSGDVYVRGDEFRGMAGDERHVGRDDPEALLPL